MAVESWITCPSCSSSGSPRWPESRYLARPGLAGMGVPELVDDPRYRRFFAWRDAFYREFLR